MSALDAFHPIVRAWFRETLGEPSAPQRQGWPAIAAGADTLILAPTGTGKTLAAFLWELDSLIKHGLQEPLPNAIHVLYVSPLKALGNDIQRNLEGPLAALKARFEAAGEAFPEIRVAVRTGDTPPSARARMLRRTPHVLITTPESLHLLLTSVRGRTMFSELRAVIVDEIHAVAGTKRGVHLALTLERLGNVAPDTPQRIGLSATQKPLDEVARFLAGCDPTPAGEAPRFRPVAIVDCGLVKKTVTELRSPVDDLAQVDGSIWTSVAPLVLEQILGARTTLVFVNNRGQAERMAARINALAGAELALPYHGSLARERRFLLEEQLKAGALRALITTSSLELGIDVGSVDLVVQLQSPKRVAAALQRVGRAGHSLDAVSRGLFVPTFRDDALEQLAIMDAMRAGDVEPTRVVQNALDVLAQLIVAMVASDTPEWTATDLFGFVRRAYPYHALTRAAFDETLAMLAGKYPADVASELDARIHWDRITDMLTPAPSARMVATISGGTIPDRGLYSVQLADRTRLGELDEEFVHESRVGDVFQLGSSTWRIRAVEHDRVIVVAAPGAAARMPFWHGEYMARSRHLSQRVGHLRRELNAARTPDALAALGERYAADPSAIRSLAEYVQGQREITHGVPDEQELVLEHFRDDVGSVRLVLHAPFGGRITAPWGMALARRMRERLGVEVQVQTTDDGLMLRLPDLGTAPPTEVMTALGADDAHRLVLEEVGSTSLFGARFRMNAARALLLPRGNPRRRMPLWLQRLKAADLLQAVREFPSFPIVVETYRDVLQEAFDMPGLLDVLGAIASGVIGIRVVRTEKPSPFAQSLQFGFVMEWMYGDDTPRAESRATLLSLDRALLDELMGGEGADEETLVVLRTVLAERRGTAPGRQARDADELAVLVDRAGDLTRDELLARRAPAEEWKRGDPLEALLASGRLVAVDLPAAAELAGAQARRYLLVDAFPRYAAAFALGSHTVIHAGPGLAARPLHEAIPEGLRNAAVDMGAARRDVLARYMALAGPVSIEDVQERYGFPSRWVEARFADWERKQVLVRGAFGGSAMRWCSRRLLERARRRELAEARRQIAAVPLSAFGRFLQRWQHVHPDTRLSGADATATVLAQQHGLSRPAEAWERYYLPARIDGQQSLGALLASGRVVWAADPSPDTAGRTAASGIGRIRFFERGTGRLWLTPPVPDESLSAPARLVLASLRAQGALFTSDLEVATALGPRRLRDAVRELVAAGLVTNDTVEALREVSRWRPLAPERTAGEPDPTRWLPADFTPSPDRPVVQRRVNLRRLPRWRRPDGPQASGNWGGRWSLVHTPGVMGSADRDLLEHADAIARQWLARYGVVTRDWWRRERPAVEWRAIYHALKRLEFRGDVRRGYFVAGLAGAQFALPEAVELLRTAELSAGGEGVDAEPIALLTSDPANVYALSLDGDAPADPLARPRGAGAAVVTINGAVVLASEGRGRRVRLRADLPLEQACDAVLALVRLYTSETGRDRRRDLIIDTIDGSRAIASPLARTLRDAGFRTDGRSLRLYATFNP